MELRTNQETTLTMRVSPEVRRKIFEIAAQEDRTPSAVLRRIVVTHLKQHCAEAAPNGPTQNR